MKTTTASLALLSLINGIVAHPSFNRLRVRDCTPGALVCQGSSQFGLCNIDQSVIFMSVAAGTHCVCSGSDCTIAALDSGDAPSAAPSQDAPATETSTQVVSQPPSQATSEPTSQVAPPTSSEVASQPTEPATQPSEPATQPTEPASQPTDAPVSSAPVSSAPATSDPPAAASSSPAGIFKEIPTVTLPSTTQPTATSAPGSGSGSSDSSGVNFGSGKTYIKTFLGNGDASAGWPAESEWASFDSMWTANTPIISQSCTSFNQANNSPAETADLKSAIETVSQSSGIDARFILAIVMQESNGCVRAPTTSYSVPNPGLMQSHDGANSCFNVNPCPQDKIQGMIEDGVNGTASGDGLKQILAKTSGSGAEQFYKAARVYNSGSIASNGLLEDGIATHCYASDIANRLIGWAVGTPQCSIS